jgi:hypothetical protein
MRKGIRRGRRKERTRRSRTPISKDTIHICSKESSGKLDSW